MTHEVIRCPKAWALAQRGLAAVLLLASTPLLAVLFVLVRSTSRGPFLFRQQRMGRGGRTFSIWKVRTLRVDGDADRVLGVTRQHCDITPVGRWLRELKLDEIPQLWNVVRGDMAFVGPRPLPVELEQNLAVRIPSFELRRQVRPGLTSVGQLIVDDNGTGDQLVRDWRSRFVAERDYIRHRTVAYDLLVIALSSLYLLRRLARSVLPQRAQLGTSTEVLGVRISNLDYRGVIDQTRLWIERSDSRYIAVCPVHSIIESLHDSDHATALADADLCTADGVPVVWAQRLLGHQNASRVYGPTLMLKLLASAEQLEWRVALYGGHPDRLRELIRILRDRFPGLHIVSAISPPFRPLSDEEDLAYTQELQNARPDLLFVGIGSPRQEKWMAAMRGRLPGVMVGVGAAFDFHAGAVRQCPPALQRLGLEWLFRLAMEPRRLFRRYARANPEFIARFSIQLLQRLFGRNFQRSAATRNEQEAA